MTKGLGDRHIDSLESARTLAPDARGTIAHRVQLHDDTLRDGEQTVGVAFTAEQKVEIARLMMEAGFASFSPGFPAVSAQEREAVRAIRALGEPPPGVLPLCRPLRSDIEASMECGFDGVSMFTPISDSHLEYKLGTSVDEAYARMLDSIALARSHGLRVRFAFEDLTRAPIERIKRFVGGAVEAGATTGIGICDTVGILTPLTTHALVGQVVALLGEVPLMVHFHDDLGMATANSLMACIAGASLVCGTFCGLGERAGNTCHEEIAVALRVAHGVDCGVDLAKLVAVARRVSELARFPIAPNKPILGANAFRHETGIHVHGLCRDLSTYEPFPPELIGSRHQVCFGKHSGMSNVQYLAGVAGVEASEAEMTAALREIKELGTRGSPPTEAQAAEILRRAHAASAASR